VDDEKIGDFVDLVKLKKVYKLSEPSGKKKGKKEEINGTGGREIDERKEVEAVVLGMMTIKGS
jgi:EKC/KEOPS complex subunit CGI121/TPRKB